MNVEVVWDWNKNVVQVDSKYTGTNKQTNKQTNKMLTENLQACFSLKGPHPSPVRLS